MSIGLNPWRTPTSHPSNFSRSHRSCPQVLVCLPPPDIWWDHRRYPVCSHIWRHHCQFLSKGCLPNPLWSHSQNLKLCRSRPCRSSWNGCHHNGSNLCRFQSTQNLLSLEKFLVYYRMTDRSHPCSDARRGNVGHLATAAVTLRLTAELSVKPFSA